MTTIPDPKKDHIECSISDKDLFTPASVQSDIESGRYEDIYPITKLQDNGPIEFVIDNASDRFLDLSNSFLKVKCKIAKPGSQNLAETDKVSVINYPISSLLSQIDILLGGKVVSSLTNTYLYRAYIETLLNYSKKAKETQLGMGFFYKDTAGHFDELDPAGDNTGLNKRHEFGKLSKTMFLQGRVHSDIFNQGRLLLNGLPLKLTFHRQRSNLTLLSAVENLTFKVSRSDVLLTLGPIKSTQISIYSAKT